MPARTANLFLLEDLEDVSRTSELAESDLDALRAVADWIRTFVVKPHEDLGRAGTVCPFLPPAASCVDPSGEGARAGRNLTATGGPGRSSGTAAKRRGAPRSLPGNGRCRTS
jgi:hypothetical protein